MRNKLCIGMATVVLLATALPSQAGQSLDAGAKRQLAKQVLKDSPDFRECLGDENSKEISLDVKPVDLNGDGEPEYLVSTSDECACAGVNCEQWVYQRTGKGWQQLASDQGFSIKSLKTRHNAYADIVGIM
jgi:hypothetical protein